MDKEFTKVFTETKNKIMNELNWVYPKITPVNNVGFKLDYTIYWNGSFGEYSQFAVMGTDYYIEKITLVQEVAFCLRNELMSLNMIAEEMTNEIMKSYGGNRFSFKMNIVDWRDEEKGRVVMMNDENKKSNEKSDIEKEMTESF